MVHSTLYTDTCASVQPHQHRQRQIRNGMRLGYVQTRLNIGVLTYTYE